ncbi:hypothetical protein MMC09_005242 [Bachmanniomyces sp. S44760]|nr:hypothetical protein [Bachmanniomyces sp. S44760]
MASAIRAPALRYVFGGNGLLLRGYQRRWAQVHDVRFLATHGQPDRVTEKYREKLDRKAKEKGLKDVDELKEVYKDKIQTLRKSSTLSGNPPPPQQSPYPQPPPAPRISDLPSVSSSSLPPPQPSAPPPPTTSPFKPPALKTLSSFIDVEKTLALPPTEISQIWRLRHASSPTSLCASIPSSIYTTIETTARNHPQFILPLPRQGQGAEIHFLQWTFPSANMATVLFTHLAEYKLRGEYATPHTTVTHHLDLRDPKGLVLLEGRVLEGRGVSPEEGQWLVMCLQKFYGRAQRDETVRRRKLLEQFSKGDGGFRVEELLEEAEKAV